MIFNNFRVNVIVRIILFVIIAGAFALCLYDGLYLRSVYVFIALVIATAEFIRYVDKTNRDFTSFLMALTQNDFTTRYSEKGKGKSFNKLYQSFNQITNKFRTISEEKEAQFIFLSLLVEHIRVGILSIDEGERVYLINQSMKNYLGNAPLRELKDLNTSGSEFASVFRDIKVGENKLIKITLQGKLIPLTIHASELRLQGKYYKLISAQDIRNELEANELEAWQKLIRVLTHEIMNSVSPIISLSGTLDQLVSSRHTNKISFNEKDRETIQKGLEAIKIRSHGLQHFADAYRSLTKIPQPQFRKVRVSEIVGRLQTLFDEEISGKKIKLNTSYEDQFELLADSELLEQVLINLLRNAFDAVLQIQNPEIQISVYRDNNTIISISDNGVGIPKDMIDKIFIPFFTTKKSGSGVGLALSKQIIQLHGGQIHVESKVGSGTTVEIRL